MPCGMRLDYLYQIIKQEAQQKSKIHISNFVLKVLNYISNFLQFNSRLTHLKWFQTHFKVIQILFRF